MCSVQHKDVKRPLFKKEEEPLNEPHHLSKRMSANAVLLAIGTVLDSRSLELNHLV